MKNLMAWVFMTVTLAIFLATPAIAQMSSAKGSGAISDVTYVNYEDNWVTQTNSWDPILTSYIKVPNDKELVFDVSMECGLWTDTEVRSKGGGKDTATAEAAIMVRVAYQQLDVNGQPTGKVFYAYPGGKKDDGTEYGVTFCSRLQELSAEFQGIVQRCNEWGTETRIADDGTTYEVDVCLDAGKSCLITEGTDTDGDLIDDSYHTYIDFSCLDYETVQLFQRTLSANAFNFIAANVPQGEYKVTVEAEITSSTDAGNGSAEAKGLIGLGSMVIDEVRFIKGDTGQTK